jgi:hypothetical protein
VVIQNEIGATDAHAIVVSVQDHVVGVTHTHVVRE